jgi:hypothetical protein
MYNVLRIQPGTEECNLPALSLLCGGKLRWLTARPLEQTRQGQPVTLS